MDKNDNADRVGWRGTHGIHDETGAGTRGGEITFSGYRPPPLRPYSSLPLKLPSRTIIAPTSLCLGTALAAITAIVALWQICY